MVSAKDRVYRGGFLGFSDEWRSPDLLFLRRKLGAKAKELFRSRDSYEQFVELIPFDP